MKILVIADTHFKHNNEIETNLMCDKIYQVVLEQKPEIIVMLGDQLDTHNIIHMEPLNRALSFMLKLSQLCYMLYVLVGNHDRKSNTDFLSNISPFESCKLWPNTKIITNVNILEYKDFKFVFLPYVPNGRFMEALATENITAENITEYNIIFAHQEFKGCKMGAIVSSHGDEYPADFPLCISGHIHDFQILQGNIMYPGTPIQLGYGTSPSKGVLMLNIENRDGNITNNPNHFISNNAYISYEFFDLKLPKKLIVNLTPEELSTYILPENCFVRLNCKGDSKAIKEITKLDSVKEMLKNPRVKLSIKEDRSKIQINGNTINVNTKTETIPFQKRLIEMVNTQNNEIKQLFSSMFGE